MSKYFFIMVSSVCGDPKSLTFDGGFLGEFAAGCGDTATIENIKAICNIDSMTKSLEGTPQVHLLDMAGKIMMLKGLVTFAWLFCSGLKNEFLCVARRTNARSEILYLQLSRDLSAIVPA
jgi:hypothetical protein